MLTTGNTQSLSEFRETAAETIERLNKTGEAEILTIDGEARAVLMSPAVYDELTREAQLSRDVATIRQSMKEIDEGNGVEVNEAFAGIRAKLLAKKAAEANPSK